MPPWGRSPNAPWPAHSDTTKTRLPAVEEAAAATGRAIIRRVPPSVHLKLSAVVTSAASSSGSQATPPSMRVIMRRQSDACRGCVYHIKKKPGMSRGKHAFELDDDYSR